MTHFSLRVLAKQNRAAFDSKTRTPIAHHKDWISTCQTAKNLLSAWSYPTGRDTQQIVRIHMHFWYTVSPMTNAPCKSIFRRGVCVPTPRSRSKVCLSAFALNVSEHHLNITSLFSVFRIRKQWAEKQGSNMTHTFSSETTTLEMQEAVVKVRKQLDKPPC